VAASGVPSSRAVHVSLRSSHFYLAGGALCMVVILLALAFVQFEKAEVKGSKQTELQQLAKGLESQTAAQMGMVEAMILALANSGRDLVDPDAPGHLDAIVTGGMRGYPQIRSLSVVDEAGRVLGSTTVANLDLTLKRDYFGALPRNAASVQVGPMLTGRDLGDIERDEASAVKLHVFPMRIRLHPSNGQALQLLALVNADYFSLEYEATVNNPTVRIALTDRRGALIVATSNVRRSDLSSLPHLHVFKELLAQRDWGSYLGAGFDDAHVLTAYSALRKWPMVVLVEVSYADAMAEVASLTRWTMATALVSCLLIAMAALAASLLLKRHAAMKKRLGDEVQAIEARSNAVLESSVDAVITLDAAGRIVAFNPAAERMFGRQKTDCLGQLTDGLLVPASLQKAHRHGIKRYLARRDGPALSRLNRRVESLAMHSSGRLFPIELSVVSVDVGGEVFFTANVRDISERKKSAQEITALLAKHRSVAKALEQQKMAMDEHAIVTIVDLDDTILYANDKLIDISGYAREELLGRKQYEFRHYLDPVFYVEMRACLSSNKVWHGELLKRRRDGGSYAVSSTTVPVQSDDGTVHQYITIQTDITALRQTEIALQAARDRELEIGKRIQQTLLAAPPRQEVRGLWLSHYSQASRGVDGDFVEVLQLGANCVDFIIGDVMGKGVPAALLGAATKLQFSRSLAELVASSGREDTPPEPQAIVSAVHKTMTPHLQALDSFVTLTYLRIDLDRKRITWVGCGHEESLLIHTDGESTLLPNQNPPLGVLSESDYPQSCRALAPGDVLFLCSDGLPDAVGPDGERLGRDLVNQTLRRLVHAHPTPAAAMQMLRCQLLNSTVLISDDVTMALITCPPVGGLDARCELLIETASIGALRQFVLERSLLAGLTDAAAAMLELASVEVFTNIVRHAKGLLQGAPVEVIAHITGEEIVMDVVHIGDAFTPPEETAGPDMSTLPEGGFGMTIIRSACSKVEFLHHEGVNTVRMTRLLAA
jgi:sigma-B regulation protein RsbU (phosphoserine phosphatase)